MTPASSSSSLSLIKQRVARAIKGAFVADAASMGTHWTYDPAEMVKKVTSTTTPEFRTPASPSFYSSDDFPGHYKDGMLSPYGEQLLFVTEYIATFSSSTSSKTISGTDLSEGMLSWAKSFGGRPDHALTTFIENMTGGESGDDDDKQKKQPKAYPDCGADDDQAHIYMKIVPVVGLYAGSPQLLENVVTAIRVHQNNWKAVAFGIVSARLLEAVILGAPLLEALETVQKNMVDDMTTVGIDSTIQTDVQTAFEKGKSYADDTTKMKTMDDMLLDFSHELMVGKEDSPFYNFAGRSCALPGSFIGPIAMFYRYGGIDSSSGSSSWYEGALRENILASGDTCSRGVFMGAILAAAEESSPPSGWISKVEAGTMSKINDAVDKIVASTAATTD